ncbi:MAG: M20 family metallopeptidase [Planktotalea sp.]|nr:M20 aminoacylase family protein [Planktotalea sp.]MDG1085637.1 M20 family metallopeptidase [Planktotalea sp.]
MLVNNRISSLVPEVTGWRHWLHQNPELLFDLPKTQEFILNTLAKIGITDVYTGLGKTGVVAIIEGQQSGPMIGLRSDMDALPIFELSDIPHKSSENGKMHACGHDGHTAMLLGAAQYLQETRNFAGRVALVFQPAEEGAVGADAMIKDGLFEKFDILEIYGMHNMPGLPVGEFALCPGPSHAAADTFEIQIEGNGSHAARPHHGTDPIAAANAIYSALQTIISRNTDPIRNGLISVTAIQSGEAFNVVPHTAMMRGTVRTLHADTQDIIEKRMGEICAGVDLSHGVKSTLDYQRKCPININHSGPSEYALSAARSVAGVAAVDDNCPPRLGGEDFSFMLEKIAGAVINIGNGDTPGLHNPKFDFADDAIPYGISFWTKLVETRLPIFVSDKPD